MKVVILGGQQNTGNQGVSALGASCLDWLSKTVPEAECILQNGMEGSIELQLSRGRVRVQTLKLHPSKQLRSRSGTRHLRLANQVAGYLPRSLGNIAASINPSWAHLRDCDVVLDVSGGDSFSEIYSPAQFEMQCDLKELVLDLGKPLVLLPQTYGPFRTEAGLRRVASIINRASLVATRDANGVEELRSQIPGLERLTIHACPDMAFGLSPSPVPAVDPWMKRDERKGPLIGLNISELLYFHRDTFGLGVEYPKLIREIVQWALDIPMAHLLLVPHVLPFRRGNGSWSQSDVEACQAVLAEFQDRFPERIHSLSGSFDAGSIKYLIGHCDFFLGARMHACIAALSQNIPTAAMAYSKKFRGVLTLAGMQDFVVELRDRSHDEVLSQIQQLYASGEQARQRLTGLKSDVQSRIEFFFRDHLRPLLVGT
jgi:polysaccharide pyruvyl transferase WcaK-like protein